MRINVRRLSLLSSVILFSMLSASDENPSVISSIVSSQFPFSSLNTVEKQRKMSEYIVKNNLQNLLSVDSPLEYKKTVFAVVSASIMLNEQQQLLNDRANSGFLSALPFMFYPKTRKIGVGMWAVASGLKIDAVRRLPHIDVDHVQDQFKMIEELIMEHDKTNWEVPSCPQDPSDVI